MNAQYPSQQYGPHRESVWPRMCQICVKFERPTLLPQVAIRRIRKPFSSRVTIEWQRGHSASRCDLRIRSPGMGDGISVVVVGHLAGDPTFAPTKCLLSRSLGWAACKVSVGHFVPYMRRVTGPQISASDSRTISRRKHICLTPHPRIVRPTSTRMPSLGVVNRPR